MSLCLTQGLAQHLAEIPNTLEGPGMKDLRGQSALHPQRWKLFTHLTWCIVGIEPHSVAW